MKGLLLKFGIVLLLVVGLIACSDNEGSEETSGGSEATSGETEEASGETFELKMGLVAGTAQNEYEAAERLQQYVTANSDGRLSITLFPDSQLGDDRQMLEQVQEGSLDITLAEAGRFGIWVPRASLLALPYIVDDFDHLYNAIYETDYGQSLVEELETENNWKLMGTAYNGTRQTTSNRAIETLADMEGLKLRVPESDSLLDYAEYTGAAPTPMAFTEVYLALETNSVDGQENPLSTIEAQKFYEVQDYLALTNHVVNDNTYVVSTDTWNSLPEDLQQVLQEGIDEAISLHTELFEEEEATLIEKFESEGVTVTEPDLDEFKEAVSEAYPNYYEEIGEEAEDFVQQIQDAK